MGKKFTLFLIVSFLGMQLFSFLHMVEHGFEEHEHEGNVCQIFLFLEHKKYTETNIDVIAQSVEYIIFSTELSEQGKNVQIAYTISSPRAPPHFS